MWRHPTGLALDQVARPSCGENPKVLLPIARHVQKGGSTSRGSSGLIDPSEPLPLSLLIDKYARIETQFAWTDALIPDRPGGRAFHPVNRLRLA